MTDRTGQVWEAYWADQTIIYLVLGPDDGDYSVHIQSRLKLLNLNDGLIEHVHRKTFDDVDRPRTAGYPPISFWKRII